MKNRLYGSMERDLCIRRTGRFIPKFHPAEIEGTYRKFTAVNQLAFQRDTSIFFGFLHGNSLWRQSLIVHYLDTLAQPKEVTHRQNGFFRNEIKKRSCHISRHCQIGDYSHSLFPLTGQLRLYFKCTDTLYFVTEKVNTIRIFRSKRKNVNDTTPNGILSRLVHIIHIFETVAMQHVCDKGRVQLLSHIQFQGLIAQFLAGYHFLCQRIRIGNDAQAFFSFLQPAQYFCTQNLVSRILLSVLDGTAE